MESPIALNEGWSPFRKVSFRFFLIFFMLFIFPYPLNQNPIAYIPGLNWVWGQYFQGMNWLVQNVGGAIFGIEGQMSTQPTGSGDTTYSWVMSGFYLIVAVGGAIIWSILDRKRRSYSRLWKWFYMLMFYNLAYWMFVYGLIKVFGGQFSEPGIARLLNTYGESSPMRVMWTFMGSSEMYTHFSGWSETIAGLLLLFRRTRTLGALAAAGVMLNVFMMNMSYDVPVKLFSFRLMIAGLWIAAADHKRLLAMFWWNRTVPAQLWKPMFNTPWKNYTLLGIMMLVMGWHIYFYADYGIQNRRNFGPDRERPELYGIYDVDTFILNGDTIPPLMTDTVRWKKTYMDLPGFNGRLSMGIVMMNDQVRSFSAELDSIKPILTLKPFGDTVNVYTFDYSFEGENLSMNGIFEGDTLSIKTTYFNPDDFELRSRGFHWVNEVPWNRRVPYRQ